VVVVDSTKFLSGFPFLNSLGLTTIKEVKEKLKFKGKINSDISQEWYITGISYNHYSSIQLNLTVKNGSNEYKVQYQEGKFEYKGGNIPIIKSREKVSIRNFKLSVINKPIKVIEETETIKIFPMKKAS
jgi:hypothetical protein